MNTATSQSPVLPTADRGLLKIAYNVGLKINRKFGWEDVRGNRELAQAAQTFTANYAGSFDWMLHLQNEMAATGSLPTAAIPGVLNTFMGECRARRTANAERSSATTAPQTTHDTLNIANVADGRYRVVLSEDDSISVQITTGVWADEPTSRLIEVMIGSDNWLKQGKAFANGNVSIWRKAADAAPRLRAALNVLAHTDDQMAFGLAFALMGGNCVYCSRNLDTAESLTVGYGPVCAKREGQPWGNIAVPASVRIARAQTAAQPLLTVPSAVKREGVQSVRPTVKIAASTPTDSEKTKLAEIAKLAPLGIRPEHILFDSLGRANRFTADCPNRKAAIAYVIGLD